VGRLLYNLAVDAGHFKASESATVEELRAVASELRFIEGFLHTVGRSSEETSLEARDERLSRFAGRLAYQVGGLAALLEGKL
jgi:hypothetical protein